MAGKFLASLFGLKKKPTCFATVSVVEFLKDKKVDSNSEGSVILSNISFTDYMDFRTKLNDKKLKDVLKEGGAFIKLLNRFDKEYITQINEISASSTSQKKTETITLHFPPYKVTIKILW
jgi:hypothetical protein